MNGPRPPGAERGSNDVLRRSPLVVRHEEEKHGIAGEIGPRPEVLLATLIRRRRNWVSHAGLRRVHHRVAALDELRKGSMLFPARQERPSSQSFVESAPLLEYPAPERHVVAVPDTAEICHFEPERVRAIETNNVGPQIG